MNIIDIDIDNKIKDNFEQDTQTETPNQKMIWLKRIAIIFVIIFSAYLLFGQAIINWFSADASVSISDIKLATVERGEMTRDISVNGTVIAKAKPTLTSKVAGIITLNTSVGELVKKDQILATIENPQIYNLLEQEKSKFTQMELEFKQFELQSQLELLDVKRTLDEAEAKLQSAQREMRRTEQSKQVNLISGIDYETAVDNLNAATRTHQHAKEYYAVFKNKLTTDKKIAQQNIDTQALKIAALKIDIEQLKIKSPIDGQIGRIEVADYQAVTADQPIMTIINLSSFVVDIDVPQNYANQITIPMAVTINIGEQTIKGQLTSISPEIIEGVSKAIVTLDNSSTAAVRQNLKVYARILFTNKNNVLKLPKGDFLKSNNQGYLYIVNHDKSLATKRKVTFGEQSFSHIEIINGLNENDTVIISSLDQFNGHDNIIISN